MSSRINQSLAFLNNLKKIPLSAQSVDCLLSTKSFKAELLKQIAGAQKRIYLTALYLEADQAGEEILMALYQAKQNNPNLQIVVCIDFHRAQRGLIGEKKSSATNASWYQEIAKAEGLGVNIVGIPVKRKELFGVQHLKGFIFDDLVLYSGASLNNIYLQQNGRYRYDRYWLINNPELADSMIRFLEDEILSSGATASLNAESIPVMADLKNAHRKLTKNLKQAAFKYPGQSSSETLSVAPLCGLGARNNKLNKCIRKLLQSAQSEMVIFTPYFNLPAALSRDISSLLKRGVNLTIVIGDKTANDFYITEDKPFRTIGGLPYLYESNLRKFAKQHQSALHKGSLNIHLWKDGDNSFHLKGIYSDQRFMLLTGHNLNPRAWRLDVENALLIDDPKQELKALADKELHEILKHTEKITSHADIDGLEAYPAHVRKLLTRMRRIKADKIVKGII
ncbi:CDP-diacylglycerol--serine O-phosphatidyltransferase [Psychromonas aquimarina]|uniref:CDP-diacylglycerol--serine O-phosphatidyltransferase n=1 Tax=Psychromonas aquimarina TaxID=444919 RepID=UPI0004201C13|nr:CDP-diacylglycerol--serine O-phosphatidyltransferase [Psychromonas aquimarina]